MEPHTAEHGKAVEPAETPKPVGRRKITVLFLKQLESVFLNNDTNDTDWQFSPNDFFERRKLLPCLSVVINARQFTGEFACSVRFLLSIDAFRNECEIRG